jgi:prophage regulatory protein
MQTQEARDTQTHRVIRRIGLQERTGLSLATIYRLIQRGDFPKPIELSEHAVGWLVEEVDAWIQSRQRATRH